MTPFKKHLPGPHALKRSLRWYALCLGPTVGCALLTLVLMRIIDLEQSIRAAHPWLYLFLPFGVIATYAFQCPFPQKALPVALQDLHEPPNDNGPHHALSFIYGSTLLTHLFGGSAGREGAGFQAAAVIGQRFGGRYGHEGPPRRIVVSSATAAVFAVLFGTPIAAGVFAFELTRAGRFPANSLVPCFAGGLAGSIVTVVAGPPASQFKHLFSVLPPAAGGSPLPAEPCLFLIVLLLGILAGGLSCAFTELSLQVRYLCSWVIEPRWVAPLLASVALAALGFFTPARAYMGLGIRPAGPHEP